MNQEDLDHALERLLSERLAEAPVTDSSGALGAVRKAIRRLHHCLAAKPGPHAPIAQQEQRIARIRSLPPHVQELLRRYYVFLEAEESICSCAGTTPDQFRRLRREAGDYILNRRERKPDFEL